TDLTPTLSQWLTHLQNCFLEANTNNPNLDLPLKVLLEPCQQVIGDRVYEVLFLADTDGLPLEFIRDLTSL
ncbi:MAG: VOC family protein, partial [Microcystaceae cyanobacterium]